MPSRPIRAALAAWLALAAAPGPAGATTSAKLPPAPHPALWKLADADTTIYLFGTIHALPSKYQWEDDRLKAAAASADRLVIEALIDPDPARSAALLLRLGTSPGLPPLADRVPPNERRKLAKVLKKDGLDASSLNGMKTWTAALIMSSATLAKLALSSDDGVEAGLRAQFAAAHKPVEGLETAEMQLGFLDSLPEADQRAFLVGVVDDKQDTRPEFDDLVAAWARGDVDQIARSFTKEMKDTPGLDAALIDKRNAAWAAALVARLATPGTILVAVGAGHLAGPVSVQTMLAKRGYKIDRIQ